MLRHDWLARMTIVPSAEGFRLRLKIDCRKIKSRWPGRWYSEATAPNPKIMLTSTRYQRVCQISYILIGTPVILPIILFIVTISNGFSKGFEHPCVCRSLFSDYSITLFFFKVIFKATLAISSLLERSEPLDGSLFASAFRFSSMTSLI